MLFVNAKGQAEKSLNREQVEYRKCYQEALSSAEALLDIRRKNKDYTRESTSL